jgi:ligand-binding sensor domain-containing protein
MKYFLPFLFFCITQIQAQIQKPVLGNLDTKNGLPSNLTWGVATDNQGFTWIGTERGLVRYDGYQFFFIPKFTERVSSICANKEFIFGFFENTGLLKINTQTYQIDTLQATNFNNGSPNDDKYKNLFLNSHQQLWWSTAQTVQCFDWQKGKKTIYKITDELEAPEQLGHFIEDKNGATWVFGKHGAYRKHASQKALIKIFRDNFVAVVQAKNAYFWAATAEGNLLQIDPITLKILQKIPLHKSRISSVFFTQYQQQDALWIGQSSGLCLFLIKKRQIIDFSEIDKNGISINAIVENNKAHKIWFCSSNGIYQENAQSSQIEKIIIPENLVKHPVTVNTVSAQDSDTFWMGLSHTGILKWQKSTNTLQLFHYQNSSIFTNRIYILPNNHVLAGTSEGVFEIRNQTLKHLNLVGLEGKFINDITLDDEQNLWVMPEKSEIKTFKFPTLQAVQLWNQKTYKDYFTENDWHNFVKSADGKIWIIGWMPKAYGINYFNKTHQRFIETTGLFQQQNKTVSDYFYQGTLGQNQTLLVVAGGFNRLDLLGKVIQKVHCDDYKNVFDSSIWTRIGEGTNGVVWIGTSEGLYAYMKDGKQILKLKTTEGLISNDIANGFLIAPDNAVIVGGVNGFNMIPKHFLNTKKSYNNLIISNLKINNQEIPIPSNQQLVLERNQTNLVLDFSTLDYNLDYIANYRYRLDEGNWVSLGNKPQIRFDNLKPNQYQLEVQAGDNSGNWNTETFKMNINLQKAFYETTFFYGLITLLLAGFFYGLYQFRYRQLLQLQHIREKISKDLHDEVGSTMSGISILGGIIQQNLSDNPLLKNFTERIVEDSQRVGDTLDDIVWSVKPKNDHLDQLLIRMKRFASDLFDAKDIDYQFVMPNASDNIKLSMDERYDIYLIYKEIINNLVKYAKCTKVSVKIEINKGFLWMEIKDNGIGFNPNQQTERNGIRNMKSRTENLGGHIDINSEIGKGTEISLKIPLK